MSRAQRLLRYLYTLEAVRRDGQPMQAGALCWREGPDGLEILLVTSRRNSRWGVPKGWTLRGRQLHRTAEREAWEEAGVVGSAVDRLLGTVPAPKSYKVVGKVDWQLALYPLRVDRLADRWPEHDQRERRWFSLARAADKVRLIELAPLIRSFTP